MRRTRPILPGLWPVLICALSACQSSPTPKGRPNIVVIYADDLGYGDLGCYGAAHDPTPNLDRLAEQGVRFTDFYVAQPVCSASRAALLTGCYPNRLGIHGALGPGAKHGIHPDETTLAEVCRGQGYRTAIYGKWHLGHLEPFLPMAHGFDEFYGIPYSNDMWPFHPENPEAWGDLPTLEGSKVVGYNTDQSRFTTDFTQRATQFVRRCARDRAPFFLYLAHPMPHVPLFVSTERAGASGQGLFGDVIREVDWSVGQVMKTLDDLGLADNTLVVFASDNGPWLSYGNHAGSAIPLREGKGTTFDGGVRVPMLARLPGTIPAGSTQTTPAMTIDLLPTIANLIGAPLPAQPIDGRDIGPLLRGVPGAESPHEAYYFYYGTNELQAVRSGRWKLHLPHRYRTMEGREPGRDGIPGKYQYGVPVGPALFDLARDVGETTDVAEAHPEVMARMMQLAERARADMGDKLTDREGPGRREPGRAADSQQPAIR